jgi:DNA mismatch repair protein MutS
MLVKSLKSSTRFTTRELQGLQTKTEVSLLQFERLQSLVLEYLRAHVLRLEDMVRDVIDAISEIDVTCALAEAAVRDHLCRPIVDESLMLHVDAGFHLPVAKSVSSFVPNSLVVTGGGGDGHDAAAPSAEPSLQLLTAPNASGKSTFLRQNALIVVMAQAGCFVPASHARLGVVDRLFARVGAGDDIVNSRSTFMCEMEEAATLLTQSTSRSFVIVDELGRGTSPEEGLALAWSCLEELLHIGCRTLFATHFHRLALDEHGPAKAHASQIKCITTLVKYDEVGVPVFTYRVVPGSAPNSFALHVATLAGIPHRVVERAKLMLDGGSEFPR